ncbi:MAG TPA: glycosyltransferase family 4 protein [Actinomycetota bacterium]|nr:glycosyltransferase family 4 protein [Actinomycetota bacterium]
MRILFLTGHLPFPPVSGGRRRENEILHRLAPKAEVEICAVSKTFDEDLANAELLSPPARSVAVFRAAGDGLPADRFDGSPTPPQVARHASAEASRHVAEAVGRVDLVHVEGFYLMQHLPDETQIPIVLVEQNVEYALFRQRAAAARTRALRRSRLLDYARTLLAETKAWERADVVGALTTEDRERMLASAPELRIQLVPNGIDRSRATDEPVVVPDVPQGTKVVMVANFGYLPNVDAALHLVRDVMPLVWRTLPEVKVVLVGNAPPAEIRALARDRVIVTGRVPAVDPYLDSATVVACPLRVGGGVKVKVLEALARGKAIVATPVGVEGIAGAASALRIASGAPAFARALSDLLTDGLARAELEMAAKSLAERFPTWDEAVEELWYAYRSALELGEQRLAAAGS